MPRRAPARPLAALALSGALAFLAPPAPALALFHIAVIEGLLLGVFGADLDAALSAAADTDGARCQGQALSAATKSADGFLKAALKAKKAVLKAGAGDEDAFLAAFAGALDTTKLAAQQAKLAGGVADRCAGAAIAALFPGACAASATADELADCVVTGAQLRACAAFFEMDGLSSASCN
jgi:hypothetical protein